MAPQEDQDQTASLKKSPSKVRPRSQTKANRRKVRAITLADRAGRLLEPRRYWARNGLVSRRASTAISSTAAGHSGAWTACSWCRPRTHGSRRPWSAPAVTIATRTFSRLCDRSLKRDGTATIVRAKNFTESRPRAHRREQ